ncbi:segregation and condensation protein B [Fervidobacterium changbaicum]|uniref:SMC-Scp complex subunit ScpB n=1 Tax=Fervidobacterium islandicum TaxID=2423 RepID=A0AAI8CMJ5_FERIS|nr:MULTISPECIES: SMC-Scp complex subunit ScpB [Fervidobacterium]AMW33115.1 SMC-Scp complex subunit ScpB [Fervidobacterium islandicum]SDH12013.1 segregation and condensation protein B [Fervidobacterium changbaicum]
MSRAFERELSDLVDESTKTLQPDKISLVEAIIFASRGVSKATLAELTDIPDEELDKIITYLKKKYDSDEHGIELKQIEDYYRFYTKSKFADVVSKVAKRRNLGSLSPAQLEIAVFLAVRRQATKLEIDSMRGKDSSNLIKQLLVSGVIKRRKLGRTFVYSLTDTFKDESMIEELVRQAGGASFESIGKMLFETPETIQSQDTQQIQQDTSNSDESKDFHSDAFEVIRKEEIEIPPEE